MKKPILISGDREARTQSPQFSIDNTRIAFLAMNTPMLEAENLHFEIYNILTNKIDIISDPLDISVNEFTWINSYTLRFTAEKIGQIKIYDVDISLLKGSELDGKYFFMNLRPFSIVSGIFSGHKSV